MSDLPAGAQHDPLLSPCIGVCLLEGDMCIGCGRTAHEITVWPIATESDQQQIIRLAGERLAARSGPRRKK